MAISQTTYNQIKEKARIPKLVGKDFDRLNELVQKEGISKELSKLLYDAGWRMGALEVLHPLMEYVDED